MFFTSPVPRVFPKFNEQIPRTQAVSRLFALVPSRCSPNPGGGLLTRAMLCHVRTRDLETELPYQPGKHHTVSDSQRRGIEVLAQPQNPLSTVNVQRSLGGVIHRFALTATYDPGSVQARPTHGHPK
jgi:hypothetical protein